MGSAFRPGIAVRLHALFAALLAALLVSSALALLTLRALEDRYESMASDELKTVVLAHRISQDGEGIAGQAPLLALADNPVTLRTAALRLADQVGWLERGITGLADAGVPEERVRALLVRQKALAAALDGLGDAVRHRIEQDAAGRLTSERLTDLAERLSAALAIDPAPAEVRAALLHADRMLHAAFAIQAAWTPADLDRHAGALRLAAAEARRAFDALPPDHARRHAAMWEGLAALAQPPADLASQRRAALGGAGRVAGALYGARAAAEDLAAASSALVADVERSVEAGRAAVAARTATDRVLLSIAVLVALMLAVAVFFYVQRTVAARLRAVQASVLAHVRGEQLPIPVGGRDEIGDIGRAFAYFVDEVAVRQRALSDSERQFREALEAAPFPIVLAGTADLGVLFANRAAEAVFGARLSAGSALSLFADGPERAAVVAALEGRGVPETAAATGPRGQEVRILQGDGGESWAVVSATAVRFMSRAAWLFTFYDVSRLKQAETRLTTLVGDLERSNADLEQFAYVASHDLREPLRMVSSYLTLLRRRYETTLDADGREFLAFAVQGAQRMDRLILDLLAFSRVGRGGAPPGPVDTGAVARQAAANLALTANEAGAVIDISPGLPTLPGREGDLLRLFQNLIANAIRYRAPERAAYITLTCAAEASGAPPFGFMWHFAVADNGIGIPADQRERVFLLFQRLHGHSSDDAQGEGGTGIGLAVCRKVVESHGGRIWIESDDGIGTTVHFTLPAASPETEEPT